MIYLVHPDGRIEASAARCEARGFVRCSYEVYVAYWRRKDRRAGSLWHAPAPVAPQERAVGERWKPSWVLRDIPKKGTTMPVIYDGPDACTKCLGWGKIANDDEQTPWKYWAELPPPSNLAVQIGMVFPVKCPTCEGTGKALQQKA